MHSFNIYYANELIACMVMLNYSFICVPYIFLFYRKVNNTVPVKISHVAVSNKVSRKHCRVAETLHSRVHVTCVTHVSQSSQPGVLKHNRYTQT